MNGFDLARLDGAVRGCATTDKVPVARRANFGFEKRQKEMKRQQKREEKAAKKREKRENRAGGEPGGVTPAVDDVASVGRQGDADEAGTKR